jgi:nitrogen fixation protein FixH
MAFQSAQRHEIHGRHVLIAMLMFFGAIIAINIAFSFVAVRSFPGEDEKRSYLQGLRYNEKLAARAAQADLGWTARMEALPQGNEAQLSVRFADRGGRPLDGLAITGKLRRPATTREDRAVTFTGAGDGIYVAHVAALGVGGWVFQGAATRGTERFEFERRMTWTPPQQP